MSTPETGLVPVVPCTNQDVADLLRARTKDDAGIELGQWSDATRPTAAEVDRLIELATGDVLSQTGANLPERDAESARTMIALRSAMLVELSYFPEQVRSDRSAYEEYKRLYDDGMAALLESISGGGVSPEADLFPGMGTIPIRSWTRTTEHVWPVEPLPPAREADG